MRHFFSTPAAVLRIAAATAACTNAVTSHVPVAAYRSPITCAVRLQSQSRPFGRGGGAGFGAGGAQAARLAGTTASTPLLNKTKDGELSFGTRVAMRDDTLITTEIFKHLPKQGAISLKSLFSALHEDVQEALSEQHGGLRSFVEQRKQIFTVRPHPTDGVLYVVGNPLVAQQYATRDAQRRTMMEMMGLDEKPLDRRPGGGGASRGRGRGGSSSRNYDQRGDGQPGRRYSRNDNGGGNSSTYGNQSGDRGGRGGDYRRPPQSRDDRRPHDGGNNRYGNGNHGGGNGRYGGNGNNNSSSSSSSSRGGFASRERRPLGSNQQSFGTR